MWTGLLADQALVGVYGGSLPEGRLGLVLRWNLRGAKKLAGPSQ